MGTDRTEGLRFLRLDRGLSARALAVKAGVSHGQILRAERRRTALTPRLAARLAKALGVPVEAIMPPGLTPVARERFVRGLGMTEAANYCGVSYGVLARAEAGEAVRPANAKAIADAYGLRVMEVLRESAESAA